MAIEVMVIAEHFHVKSLEWMDKKIEATSWLQHNDQRNLPGVWRQAAGRASWTEHLPDSVSSMHLQFDMSL